MFIEAARRNVQRDQLPDDLFTNRRDGILDLIGLHQLGSLVIHDLALIVGDVVVLEQALADVEVVRLDLTLSAFDLARQQLAFDRLALAHTRARQQVLGALRVAEYTHQLVFHRQVEATRTGIALSAGTPAQLIVDTA